jgi:hypothetical protein
MEEQTDGKGVGKIYNFCAFSDCMCVHSFYPVQPQVLNMLVLPLQQIPA